MFAKKVFGIAMPRNKITIIHCLQMPQCSMSGANNAHLFMITGINTFPGNKGYYKAVISCQTKDVPILFQLSIKKAGSKAF